MERLLEDLSNYYDREAHERAQRGIDPHRIDCRRAFIDQLMAESRSTVVEIGSGPGLDAAAFLAAGLVPTAIDLSYRHVQLTSGKGIGAVRASMFELPFRPRAFDAAWTMSTLVHVPDARFDEALTAIVATLTPGAPLAIGLWGGLDREGPNERDDIRPPRFFSLRSHERARSMLARHGDVEVFLTWGRAGLTWEYQFAILRVR